MLFESFTLSFVYRAALCDLDIREAVHTDEFRSWEIVQGGIAILTMVYKANAWQIVVNEEVDPIVKHDTQCFVSQELVGILKQGIVTHYDCFTDDKIKNPNS